MAWISFWTDMRRTFHALWNHLASLGLFGRGGSTGSTAPAPLTRVAYVNSVVGDDIDGVIDNDAFPFGTITGAFTALFDQYPDGHWRIALPVNCAEDFTYPQTSVGDFRLIGIGSGFAYSGIISVGRIAPIDFTLDNINMSGEIRFDAAAGSANSGHVIRLTNGAALATITADGEAGANGSDGTQPDPATGSAGANGSDGDPPTNGEPGQSITNNGGTGADGSTGAIAVSGQIRGNAIVNLLNARGGAGGNGGGGGTGGDATGGDGGIGGNHTGMAGDGATGGDGGNATSNGGLGGTGGLGGDGGVWQLFGGATVNSYDVSGGAGGNGGGAGSGGTATGGSGGSGGGGALGGSAGNAGSPGSTGSATSNAGSPGSNGASGTTGSVS